MTVVGESKNAGPGAGASPSTGNGNGSRGGTVGATGIATDGEGTARTTTRSLEPPAGLPPGPAGPAGVTRRDGFANLVFGRKLRTDQEIHERLGNSTALAVFASDALSSVAYATEEMLRVLLPVAAVSAFALLMPLSIGIVALLVILVFSYRQTIKAYPSAGGAYIVTRDNFGVMPAQVAGVALLTDYILTVAVSVSAGIAALYSAAPVLYPYRVYLAVAVIWFITMLNLRGVKESGRIFAVPTYGFVISIIALVVFGLVEFFTGNLGNAPIPQDPILLHAGGLSLFLVLHAYASGCTAMTGVEAVSNGVPAFKPVEWKNARKVLGALGLMLGTMFLGISFLAWRMHVIPSEKSTVLSQLTRGVVGNGPLGNAMFLVVSVMTILILCLAANTAYADFPRLASFHAHDHFLPTPLTRRGRRLVFGNGIVVLAVLATLLVIVFDADVSRLIPMYAIGVFTSFTLSQAGMAKRHLRIKEEGWRRGLAINGVGAVVSGIVGVVIAVTKFTHGAWIIMIVVPLTVAVLVRVNKHYDHVRLQLALEEEAEEVADGGDDTAVSPSGSAERLDALVLVSKIDEGLDRAMRYFDTLRPDESRCVHFGEPSRKLAAAFWARYGRELEFEPMRRGLVRTARRVARSRYREHPTHTIAVIMPEVIEKSKLLAQLRHSRALRLKTGLLFERGIVLVNVPTRHVDNTLYGRSPRRHVAIVPVATVNAGALHSLRIAKLLGVDEVRAIHVAELPDEAESVEADWHARGIDISLDVVASPYREVTPPVMKEVRDAHEAGADLVTVVIGELVPKWYQHALHNHRALQLKAALLFEPDVAVVSVPRHL